MLRLIDQIFGVKFKITECEDDIFDDEEEEEDEVEEDKKTFP